MVRAAMNVTVHAAETTVGRLTGEYLPLLLRTAGDVSADGALWKSRAVLRGAVRPGRVLGRRTLVRIAAGMGLAAGGPRDPAAEPAVQGPNAAIAAPTRMSSVPAVTKARSQTCSQCP